MEQDKLIQLSVGFYAQEFLFKNLLDGEDVEETNSNVQRQTICKISAYAENLVSCMLDSTFKGHFRLSRASFEALLIHLMPILEEREYEMGRPRLGSRKQVLMAIWILANPDTYRSVSERFGVASSTCHKALMSTVDALLYHNSKQKIIAWPINGRELSVKDGYMKRYGFPGTVGAIDGCHIAIKAPADNHTSYVNRKGVHSILLQAVCDHELIFTDCYAGEAGSIHDACMLRRSPMFKRMEDEPTTIFNGNTHIIGDPAYPLKQNLLVAFKNTGRLTRREEKFNHTLSCARSTIERAFALLKGRFRRLKYLDMSCVERIPHIIMACCILHNVCLQQGDFIDIDHDETWTTGGSVTKYTKPFVSTADKQAGVDKRNAIADLLSL